MIDQIPTQLRRIEHASPARLVIESVHQTALLARSWIGEVLRNRSFRGSHTSTLFATPPWAAKKIVSMLVLEELEDGDVIVEYGPGPGPLPQTVLRRTDADIRYIGIDLNPQFTHHLQETIKDDRLTVLNGNALSIEEILIGLGEKKGPKRILSSLPMSNDHQLTSALLEVSKKILHPDGLLSVWNFRETSLDLVKNAFGGENCLTTTALNIPLLKIILAGQDLVLGGNEAEDVVVSNG